MDKLEKLIPEKIEALGHNVIVSDKTFALIIKTINAQTSTINALIDFVKQENLEISKLDSELKKSKSAISALAKALEMMTEE